jgi:hypothetical protein
MLITVPIGAVIAVAIIRLVVGAALAFAAMRRGASVRLKVGISLTFSSRPKE